MPATRFTAKRRPLISYVGECALIFSALLIVYFPALHGNTLWDDLGHLTRPDLQPLHGLWRIWTELGATQQYYPVLHSAFWIEHRLWEDAVGGYHLANISLHALAAFLLVVILRRLAIPGALLAGLIFAVHPVCVESVAWIAEQKNTLSAVFYLASALTYLQFDEKREGSRYWAAFALFVLAVLSKSVTATLPAALLVVFWWKRGRLGWRRDVSPLIPWFVVAAAGGAFTAWVERDVIGARGADFSLTLLQRCLLAGRALWFYLATLLWPSNLIFIYPHWTIDASRWPQYVFPVGAIATAVCLWLLRGRTRAPLAGFLFFAGTLFPALGFVDAYPFRFSYVADHFQYLASLGVIVPIAAGLTLAAARQSGAARSLARAGCVALVGILGVLTWRQSASYRDAETLYRDTISRNPECWMAHVNLGTELADQKRLPEAIVEFQRTLEIKPDHTEARRDLVLAHTMLGSALSDQPGRTSEAIEHLRAAVRIDSDSTLAHLTLANMLVRREDPGAIAEYEAVLRRDPRHFQARYNLGTYLLDVPGRLEDAIGHLQAAVDIRPDNAEAHLNLGIALADAPARLQDAIRQLEAALEIKPRLTQAEGLLKELRSEAARQPDPRARQ